MSLQLRFKSVRKDVAQLDELCDLINSISYYRKTGSSGSSFVNTCSIVSQSAVKSNGLTRFILVSSVLMPENSETTIEPGLVPLMLINSNGSSTRLDRIRDSIRESHIESQAQRSR